MAINKPKNNARVGAVKNRSQTQTPTGNYVKRDTNTGKFIDQMKLKNKPY